MDRYGVPDLFVNYGEHGKPILDRLGGRCFRVHVPCLRRRRDGPGNTGAECYLVDSEEYLDDRSMMYVPVVNTGELAAPEDFRAVMLRVLADRDRYRPREYFMAHWDPRTILERYVAFFRRMGWRPTARGADTVEAAAS